MKYLLFMLALVSLPAGADDSLFGDVGDESYYDERFDKKWRENVGELPAYPKDADLIPYMTSRTGVEYLIDRKSISSARKDNIVYLTVVARSPSDARTVFFEGYHCGTKKYKRYAVAGAHGPLMPLDNAGWTVIIDAPGGQFRKDLLDHVLCTQMYTAAPKNKIIDRLKNQSYLTDSFDE